MNIDIENVYIMQRRPLLTARILGVKEINWPSKHSVHIVNSAIEVFVIS